MALDRSPLLDDYPVVIALPVQWGDQDAFGHVNNIVYFRWYESARIAYFIESGIQALLGEVGLGPILARIACDYLRQLNFPDTIQVGARVARLGTKSLTIEHAIYSQAQNAVVARSDSVVVIFHHGDQVSHAIPQNVREQLATFEGKPL